MRILFELVHSDSDTFGREAKPCQLIPVREDDRSAAIFSLTWSKPINPPAISARRHGSLGAVLLSRFPSSLRMLHTTKAVANAGVPLDERNVRYGRCSLSGDWGGCFETGRHKCADLR